MSNETFTMYHVDTEGLEDGHNLIMDTIIHNAYSNTIRVLPPDPGTGKTLVSEQAVVTACKKYNRRVVFVRNRQADVDETVKRINGHTDTPIAIGYHSEVPNAKKVKKELHLYPTVVITHEKYRQIAKGIEYDLFATGRDTLIIDEKIDMVEEIAVNLNELERFAGRLSVDHRLEFMNLIYNLKSFLGTKRNQMVFLRLDDTEKTISALESFCGTLENEIDSAYVYRYLIDVAVSVGSQKKVLSDVDHNKRFNTGKDFYRNFINNLISILKGPSIVHSYKGIQTASTFNRDLKYWTLDNTIILDANGRFDSQYRKSPLFHVEDMPLVIDHSRWTINLQILNVLKSKRSQYSNFYKEINRFLHDQFVKKREDVLIVANKDDRSSKRYMKSEYIKVDHHGNFIGTNNYRKFRNIVLPFTHQVPLYRIALEYLYYSAAPIIDDKILKQQRIKNSNGVYGFSDKTLEQLRLEHQAGSLWQAIKRINRDNSQEANVYLMLHDMEVFNIITGQMMGVKVKDWSLNIKLKQGEKKVSKVKAHAQKFINLLGTLPPGPYTKEELRQMLQIKVKQTFTKVLHEDIVKDYASTNDIRMHPKTIYIP